jgi:hypothetical protein
VRATLSSLSRSLDVYGGAPHAATLISSGFILPLFVAVRGHHQRRSEPRSLPPDSWLCMHDVATKPAQPPPSQSLLSVVSVGETLRRGNAAANGSRYPPSCVLLPRQQYRTAGRALLHTRACASQQRTGHRLSDLSILQRTNSPGAAGR